MDEKLLCPYNTVLSEWVIVAQLCPTLCDPMDCGLPVSSVHGILQARILKWVAISFSIVECYLKKKKMSHQVTKNVEET